MNRDAMISIILSFGALILLLLFFLWLWYRPLSPAKILKTFFRDVKNAVLAPFYFFFGYECPVCKKKYFSVKKSNKCCSHKIIAHYNATSRDRIMLMNWEKEFGRTPEEIRQKRRERFISHFQRYRCDRCGKGHWKAVSAIECCKNKPTPPPVNVDDWLCDCYWCGGSGYKFGTICDVCSGLGKLPRG